MFGIPSLEIIAIQQYFRSIVHQYYNTSQPVFSLKSASVWYNSVN
jgi:hypothetical protein